MRWQPMPRSRCDAALSARDGLALRIVPPNRNLFAIPNSQRLPSGWNPEQEADGASPVHGRGFSSVSWLLSDRRRRRRRRRQVRASTVGARSRSNYSLPRTEYRYIHACGSAGKTMWAKQMLLAPDAPIPRADRLRERGKPRKPVVPGPSATRQACDAHLISVLETCLAGRSGIDAGRAPQVATLVRCQYFHIEHHYQQCRPMSRGFR